jgi:hypothetical protein
MKEKVKSSSGSLLEPFMWWKIDQKDVESEVRNYAVSGKHSFRKIAGYLILVSLLFTVAFVIFGIFPVTSLISIIIYLPLATLVMRGSKFFIILAMAIITIDRFGSILITGEYSISAIGLRLLWWAFQMRFLFGAYKVEKLRDKYRGISPDRGQSQESRKLGSGLRFGAKYLLAAGIVMALASIALFSFIYFSKPDYFAKKTECATYNSKAKERLDKQMYDSFGDNSAVGALLGYFSFQFGFYSPKLNTCLYVTKWMGKGGDGSYRIHDSLTEETIQKFTEDQFQNYAKFLYDYSGGEIKI